MSEELQFPFCAVVGQAPLKLALVLCALDPRLGGVLASGPRGAAKSTLARGLAALLPDAGRERFVTLPLGADEARLTGTLDLQRALGEHEVAFQPGLLARAHGGVLYIDEVNLLPDALVDLLLDVAASGVNRVERDGVSHRHAADFLLVGTMNPDEGELRPQLTDRFGLAVLDHPAPDVDERMTIVERRLAFDRDPHTFTKQWQSPQRALAQRLAAARERLPRVTLPREAAREIAERCLAAEVEGVRADLAWRRGALAHAAWRGRETVTDADIQALEALVMAHRAPQWLAARGDDDSGEPSNDPPPAAEQPSSGGDSSPGDGEGGYRRRQRPATPPRRPDLSADDSATAADPARRESDGHHDHQEDATQGDWGALQAPDAAPLAPAESLHFDAGRHDASGARRTPRGRRQHTERRRIDWPASLAAGLPRHPGELRYRRETGRPALLDFIVLDTSGSALDSARRDARPLERALGAVEQIRRRAYLARHELTIIGFGGERIDELLAPQRAPHALNGLTERLSTGGGTPLRGALLEACRRIERYRRQQPARAVRLWIITDGRSRDDFAIRPPDAEVHVIDCAPGRPGQHGRAAELAEALGATHHLLDTSPTLPPQEQRAP